MELKKSKGLFYSADALLAVSILFIFMLVAMPLVKVNVEKSEIQYDVINALSSTRISDLRFSNISAQNNLSYLISSGQINDSSKNVLEALGGLYIMNPTQGTILARDIFANIDSEYNIGIWIGDNLIYSTSSYPVNGAGLKYVDTASQIISGVEQGKNITGFAARAFLSKTQSTKYYYFGGYVGDGNISIITNYNGNITSAEIELAINEDFQLYINGNYSGNYSKSVSEYSPQRYILPIGNFTSGNNTVELKSSSSLLRIAGGFIKINYKGDVEVEQENKYYFPGIKGVINLYDGFYLPSALNSMQIYLHYESSQNISVYIGNKSVYDSNTSGEKIVTINDSSLRGNLSNYAGLIGKNIPIRVGLDEEILSNASKMGNADVVFVTDRSGSMDTRIGAGSGTLYCGDGTTQTYTSNTPRITILKCLLKNFTATILNGPGNNISLVSYGSNAQIDRGLINNFTLLNNTITGYASFSNPNQYTCISCGINEAYEVLKTSQPNRTRFIIVMTDGQANRRSTTQCIGPRNDAYGISNAINLTMYVGDSGLIVNRSYDLKYFWKNISSSTSNNLKGINIYNQTLAFAVGDSGNIYKWNGASWSSNKDTGDLILYSVDIYNQTFGLAVGENGNTSKWNGSAWITGGDVNSNSNLDLYSVDIYNKTFGLAVGEGGYVYTWNGAGWNSATVGSTSLRSVNIYNSTLAFSVGDSGDIYKWNGISWVNDYAGAYALNSIYILNDSTSFAVGRWENGVVVWNGTFWRNYMPEYHNITGTQVNGLNCNDGDDCSLFENVPSLNAIYSSNRSYKNFNATVNAIGFSIDNCNLGLNTISSIAGAGNGSWNASSDPSKLSKWFQDISGTILNISFSEQVSKVLGNYVSRLYPDSYILFDYNSSAIPTGIRFPIESKFTNESNGRFSLLTGDTLIDARVMSYSGPKWTQNVYLNNTLFYNLSIYGKDFNALGDPFNIYLPSNLINSPGNTSVNLTLYPSGVLGSLNNSIIYNVLREIKSFSEIRSKSDGCYWHVKTESNGIINFKVPTDYSGSRNCYYNATYTADGSGAEQDVLVVAVRELLSQLDLNTNGEIDVNLQEENFQVDISQVSGIPYEWKTKVEVRVWK